MRITLNLATRPFADVGPAMKRLRIAMAVLAVIAIGLGLGLRAFHQKAEEARARDHSLDGQIARITQERQSYQAMMQQPANAELLKQSIALNQLFNEKAFSWTLAMEDLETVLPGRVQVLTLEPVPDKEGHVILHLRVAGPRDLDIELIRNLEHSHRFLSPRIVGETPVETTGRPGEVLAPVSISSPDNFDVLAEYNPAVPAERRATRKPAAAVREDQPATPPQTLPGAMIPNHWPVRPPYAGPDNQFPVPRRAVPMPVPVPRDSNRPGPPPQPESKNEGPR
jgi:type IV pilus assembly protein PilN